MSEDKVDMYHVPETSAALPEAGGIAYTDIWTKTGVEISITARATTATEALDQLYAAIAHGIKEYGMLTSHTQVPRPTPEQVSADVQANGRKRQTKPAPAQDDALPGEDTDTITVERYEVQTTAKGDKILKVFGGRWKKFGVTCWPEVSPWDMDDLEPGETWPADPNTVATVLLNDKGNPSKVLAFS